MKKRPVGIGLTGSFGMGNSKGAANFRHLGLPVFDADAAVREVQGPNGVALPAIEAAARALIARPELAPLFNPAHYRVAHNELALIDGDGQLHRIDRVVEHDDGLWLIDYKTGEDSLMADDAELVARHRPQLDAYRALLAALKPGRAIRAALLRADGRLVDVAAL